MVAFMAVALAAICFALITTSCSSARPVQIITDRHHDYVDWAYFEAQRITGLSLKEGTYSVQWKECEKVLSNGWCGEAVDGGIIAGSYAGGNLTAFERDGIQQQSPDPLKDALVHEFVHAICFANGIEDQHRYMRSRGMEFDND